jgi:hypothetical protein
VQITSTCRIKVQILSCYRVLKTNKRKAFTNKVTDSEKAQDDCYLVAERTSQKRKSTTVGEKFVMPTCKILEVKMLGQDTEEILKLFHFQRVQYIDILMTCHLMLTSIYVVN